jgi:hypothetical protein
LNEGKVAGQISQKSSNRQPVAVQKISKQSEAFFGYNQSTTQKSSHFPFATECTRSDKSQSFTFTLTLSKNQEAGEAVKHQLD